MTGFNWERWSRAAGIGFVVAYVVGFIVLSEPPKVNASADDVVSFFEGDRSRVLTAMVIFGIAFALLLFFVGAIANLLRERDRAGSPRPRSRPARRSSPFRPASARSRAGCP